jgi:hypothetical protein
MRKQSKGCAGLIFAGAVIVAITLGAAPLLDRLFLPWAFENNSPTLTGSWVGSLTTLTGQPRGVPMELWLPEPKGKRWRCYFRR